MITRNEAILLLSELENKGINVDKQLQEVMTRGLSKELLVFLNDHRPLDIHNFYEKLRKNYNKKKSKLRKSSTPLAGCLYTVLVYCVVVGGIHRIAAARLLGELGFIEQPP